MKHHREHNDARFKDRGANGNLAQRDRKSWKPLNRAAVGPVPDHTDHGRNRCRAWNETENQQPNDRLAYARQLLLLAISLLEVRLRFRIRGGKGCPTLAAADGGGLNRRVAFGALLILAAPMRRRDLQAAEPLSFGTVRAAVHTTTLVILPAFVVVDRLALGACGNDLRVTYVVLTDDAQPLARLTTGILDRGIKTLNHECLLACGALSLLVQIGGIHPESLAAMRTPRGNLVLLGCFGHGVVVCVSRCFKSAGNACLPRLLLVKDEHRLTRNNIIAMSKTRSVDGPTVDE